MLPRRPYIAARRGHAPMRAHLSSIKLQSRDASRVMLRGMKTFEARPVDVVPDPSKDVPKAGHARRDPRSLRRRGRRFHRSEYGAR